MPKIYKKTLVFLVCLAWILIFLPACVNSRESELIPPFQREPITPIYIVNHGRHAGIILKRSNLPGTLLHEDAFFPNAEFLEIGWGDMDYYQAQNPHIGVFLKAALWPTSSVLHIVGFNRNPTAIFPGREIVRIYLTLSGMEKLRLYIGNSFAKNEKGFTQVVGTGLYGDSFFICLGKTITCSKPVMFG